MPASELVEATGPLTDNSVNLGGASGRAEAIMTEAVDLGVLSDAGKSWIEVALDPFHDTDIFVRGLPDYAACDTIVQNVRAKIDVTAPPGLLANESYDCHIFFSPRDTTVPKSGFLRADGNVITGNETSTAPTNILGPWGNVTVACVKTGLPTLPSGSGGIPNYAFGTVTRVDAMSPADMTTVGAQRTTNYVNGKHRIIGGGVEVINTTEPLYRSGAVIGYRVPSELVQTVATLYSENLVDYASVQQDCLMYQLNPGTSSEALNLPSSRMWAAEKGAYYPFRFEGETQPFREPRQVRFLGNSGVAEAINGNTPFGTLALTEDIFYTQGPQPPPTGNNGRNMGFPYKTTPTGMALGGIYFVGLSAQTKLVVNARWCIERCPDNSETDLKVLTHVSPPFDERAWAIYTEAISRMPPFVPLDENPLGEWFSDVVSAALPALGGAAQGFLTGGPAGAIAGGLNGLGQSISRRQAPRAIEPKKSALPTKQKQSKKKKKKQSKKSRTTFDLRR